MALSPELKKQFDQTLFGNQGFGGGGLVGTPLTAQAPVQDIAGSGLLPNLFGIGGQIGGNILGAPLGPAGIEGGGIAGSALMGGVGQSLQDIMGGQNPLQGVPSAMGQQAVWGAIPGMSEMKLGGKLVESPMLKALMQMGVRGLMGYGGAAGAKAVQNVGAEQPIGQDVNAQGLQGAGLNMALPGLANIAGKGIGAMGLGKGGLGAQAVADRTGIPLKGFTTSGVQQAMGKAGDVLRHQMATFLDATGKTMSKGQVFKILDDMKALGKNRAGITNQDDFSHFIEGIKNGIDNAIYEHLQQPEGEGIGSPAHVVSTYGKSVTADNPTIVAGGRPAQGGRFIFKGAQAGQYVPKSEEGAAQVGKTTKFQKGGQSGTPKFIPPSSVGNTAKTAVAPELQSKMDTTNLPASQKAAAQRANVLTKVRDQNLQLPLSFWHEIQRSMGNDVNWLNRRVGGEKGYQQAALKGAIANIKQMIGDAVGNPKEYKALRGNLETLANINNHISKNEGNIVGMVRKQGPVALEAILGLLTGGIPGAVGAGLGGEALQQPGISSTISNALTSPTGQRIMSSLSRLGGVPLLYSPSNQNQ